MENLKVLWEFRYVIIVIVAVVLYAFLEWQNFKVKAYAIMLQAKGRAKDAVLKSGKEQEEWVVKKLYQRLPKTWTNFISEERLGQLVKYLYDKAKDSLDDGELNNSVK